MVKIGVGGLTGKLDGQRQGAPVPLSCSGEGACSGKVSVVGTNEGQEEARSPSARAATRSPRAEADAATAVDQGGPQAHPASLSGKSVPGVFQLNDPGRPTSLNLKRAVQLPRGN